MSDFELVIVGGGLASARAIKSYRAAGGEGRILLVSKDASLPYHRPPLSKRYLRGEVEAVETLVEPREFYETNDVELLLETTVARVDLGERVVELAGGRRQSYGKLLIASGATPRRLEVPGFDLAGVFTLRTLADSTEIRAALDDGHDALVVGGGFIGMEVAASLHQLGVEVTLVHRQSGLFQHLEAPELERDLASLLADNGVAVVLPGEVAAFRGHSHVDSIVMKTGETLTPDFVVVGVGVSPTVDFLEDSSLELANGVVVNERFETSAAGVYAVGDVANFHDPLYGRRRIEHWSNANYQGAEVGKILAGTEGGYDTVSTFFTEIFGLTLKLFGDLEGYDELVVRGSLAERDLLGFYLAGGYLVATLVVGQVEGTEERLKELLRDRAAPKDTAGLADPANSLDELFPARMNGAS